LKLIILDQISANYEGETMKISRGIAGLGRSMLLPAALLLAGGAQAQTSDPRVIVKGTRTNDDATVVTLAKSKVMARDRASSCNFMSTYNANEDDITLQYMSDFGMEDSISNPAERIRENSPGGDAQSAPLSSSFDSEKPDDTNPNAPSVSCGAADRAFAAGRNHIERKDKTLGQAFAALERKDYPAAIGLFKTAYSKVGYEEAALMLGKMYLYGMGTAPDSEQAIHWLREVTDARYDPAKDRFRFDPRAPQLMNERVQAAITLAKIYLTGRGVRRDPVQARKWYARAAEVGFVPAANTLGLASLSGYGGERNPSRALGYFKEAADAGYVPAEYNLAKLYYNGDAGVPRDLKLAGAWFEAAAKAGHAGALYGAGRMYDLGEGVAPDQKKAIVYYKEAAVKGNPDAESALATYFYSGEQVPKDLTTARKLFNEAAMHGQADAMFNLAVMSAKGEGGPRDLSMAYVWLSLAKSAGHKDAGAALAAVAPQLNKQDLAKADAILKPQPKAAKSGGG
jgi:TPR repeat protein